MPLRLPSAASTAGVVVFAKNDDEARRRLTDRRRRSIILRLVSLINITTLVAGAGAAAGAPAEDAVGLGRGRRRSDGQYGALFRAGFRDRNLARDEMAPRGKGIRSSRSLPMG